MISGPTANRQRGIVPVLGETHVAGRSARADEVGLRAGPVPIARPANHPERDCYVRRAASHTSEIGPSLLVPAPPGWARNRPSRARTRSRPITRNIPVMLGPTLEPDTASRATAW